MKCVVSIQCDQIMVDVVSHKLEGSMFSDCRQVNILLGSRVQFKRSKLCVGGRKPQVVQSVNQKPRTKQFVHLHTQSNL